MTLPFFTRRELAECLRVSVRMIDKLCEQGKLQFHRVGTRKRFSYNDLENYLNRASGRGVAGQGTARRGKAWRGSAGPGEARQGKVISNHRPLTSVPQDTI